MIIKKIFADNHHPPHMINSFFLLGILEISIKITNVLKDNSNISMACELCELCELFHKCFITNDPKLTAISACL